MDHGELGFSWTRGGLLPLGRDTITGAVSFAGRSGWLVVETPAFQQLLGHGTGFAWGLESLETPGLVGRTVLVLKSATRTGCPGLAEGRLTHWNHALRSRGG